MNTTFFSSPCLSGGGEAHYKMCRRKEERQTEQEGRERLCGVRWVVAFFEPYSLRKCGQLIRICIRQMHLWREMFYYMLPLKSMINCSLFSSSPFIHRCNVYPCHSADFSSLVASYFHNSSMSLNIVPFLDLRVLVLGLMVLQGKVEDLGCSILLGHAGLKYFFLQSDYLLKQSHTNKVLDTERTCDDYKRAK